MYKVEGTGQTCVPKVLEMDKIDDWVQNNDEETFIMAKRLMKEEGMLIGGSAGSSMHGAIKYLKEKGLSENPDLRYRFIQIYRDICMFV